MFNKIITLTATLMMVTCKKIAMEIVNPLVWEFEDHKTYEDYFQQYQRQFYFSRIPKSAIDSLKILNGIIKDNYPPLMTHFQKAKLQIEEKRFHFHENSYENSRVSHERIISINYLQDRIHPDSLFVTLIPWIETKVGLIARNIAGSGVDNTKLLFGYYKIKLKFTADRMEFCLKEFESDFETFPFWIIDRNILRIWQTDNQIYNHGPKVPYTFEPEFSIAKYTDSEFIVYTADAKVPEIALTTQSMIATYSYYAFISDRNRNSDQIAEYMSYFRFKNVPSQFAKKPWRIIADHGLQSIDPRSPFISFKTALIQQIALIQHDVRRKHVDENEEIRYFLNQLSNAYGNYEIGLVSNTLPNNRKYIDIVIFVKTSSFEPQILIRFPKADLHRFGKLISNNEHQSQYVFQPKFSIVSCTGPENTAHLIGLTKQNIITMYSYYEFIRDQDGDMLNEYISYFRFKDVPQRVIADHGLQSIDPKSPFIQFETALNHQFRLLIEDVESKYVADNAIDYFVDQLNDVNGKYEIRLEHNQEYIDIVIFVKRSIFEPQTLIRFIQTDLITFGDEYYPHRAYPLTQTRPLLHRRPRQRQPESDQIQHDDSLRQSMSDEERTDSFVASPR